MDARRVSGKSRIRATYILDARKIPLLEIHDLHNATLALNKKAKK